MKIKIEIDTDDWKDLELIEKFMMDLLPESEEEEGDEGGEADKKTPDSTQGVIKVGRTALEKTVCLHEFNKLSPDPMYEDQERILFQTGKQKTSGEKWEKVDVRSNEKHDQENEGTHLKREA